VFLKRWLADAVRGHHASSLPNNQPADERPCPLEMAWTGDRASIKTTAAGHERIAEALKAIRQYGLAEVMIEAVFLTGPAEELQRAGRN
jgi:hypothetical protein